MNARTMAYIWTVVVAMMVICAAVVGQQPPQNADNQAGVKLNFPQEIEVAALVDYVSQRLGVKILYDEQVANKKITIRSPGEVPAASLLAVLESALKMKGLVLVDAEAPGWKRIVAVTKLANVAPAGRAQEAINEFGRGTAVTEAFVLQHTDPATVDKYIKPFLTDPGSNSVAVPEAKMLIVTDYATNILKIARWIEFIDKPRPAIVVETITIKHIEAAALAAQLQAVLSARARAQGVQAGFGVEIAPDPRTNQVFLIGDPSHVASAKQMIEFLDVPLDLVTRTYTFRNVDAQRIDTLAQELIDPLARKRLYRSAVDTADNLLIVTTTAEIHGQIENLRRSLDIDRPGVQSPIRYYKIKNLPAAELLQTIRSIEQQTAQDFNPRSDWQRLPTDGLIRPARAQAISGPNLLPPPAGDFPPPPPAYQPTPPEATTTPPGQPMQAPPSSGAVPPPGATAGTAPARPVTSATAEPETPIVALLGRARITADLHTNTLIVVAEPQVQKIYAELIEKLDQRRPQVLIEARVVILNTSNDFSLGVEVSGGDGLGAKRLFAFSSFGLSQVDAMTGALSLIPGLGFNGTLVDPQAADVVIRALATHKRARVLSAPRVLVNDNATGQLTSVQEVPFTSINASQTVATTTFAGFAEAGTTITVTPRISDDNHLQLDFAVTLNTFTGTGSAGVPPPRQTEQVTSQVTIPDGYTVIVGGLNQKNASYDYTGIPGADMIPIVRYLLGNVTTTRSKSTMFVFIRPVILRDDKFKDLKFVSDRDLCRAKECPNAPASRPVWMR